jgi:hypothetical protein
MSLITATDAAAALEAVRAQRAAASHSLEVLEAICGMAPRGECLPDWAGASNAAYLGDLAELLSSLATVRAALRDAVDDLWVVIGEAGDD